MSSTPQNTNGRVVLELSELSKISKTFNQYSRNKSVSYNQNGRKNQNKPASPVFIRRGLFNSPQPVAGLKKWNMAFKDVEESGAFGLDEYVSVDRSLQLEQKSRALRRNLQKISSKESIKINGIGEDDADDSFIQEFGSEKVVMSSSSSDAGCGTRGAHEKLTKKIYMNDSYSESSGDSQDLDDDEESESSSDDEDYSSDDEDD